MPIYQYKCTDCGHGLEALQKMSDPKLVDCPECNAPTLKKQLTAAAFKLKGTGWYETDSKNIGKKPVEKSAETKSESKPASVPESKPSASVE
ncbi:MAG: putative FmdB family regulatory protein [Arenicella sp.]|jgi:putative FmdB family regulatory protein